MRPLTRRGFTLAELLVGLMLLALCAGVVVAVVRGAGRVASRSLAALTAGRTLLSLQTFLHEELRDGVSSDVTPLGAAQLAMSRSIGDAMPCADSTGALLIADSAWRGTRLPQGGRDDVLLLTDPVAETWLRLAVDSVSSAQCPADLSPAIRLNVAVHSGTAAIARVVEPVELSAYRSGTMDWFGLTPASHASAVQPFAGPLLTGATRFNWYSDRLEVAITLPNAIVSTVHVPLTPP